MTEGRYFSRKDLVERGWSKRIIKRLLPGTEQPDSYGPPLQAGLLPVPLFREQRILDLEKQNKIIPSLNSNFTSASAHTERPLEPAPELLEETWEGIQDRPRQRPKGFTLLGRSKR